jgi:hypothetical protein
MLVWILQWVWGATVMWHLKLWHLMLTMGVCYYSRYRVEKRHTQYFVAVIVVVPDMCCVQYWADANGLQWLQYVNFDQLSSNFLYMLTVLQQLISPHRLIYNNIVFSVTLCRPFKLVSVALFELCLSLSFVIPHSPMYAVAFSFHFNLVTWLFIKTVYSYSIKMFNLRTFCKLKCYEEKKSNINRHRISCNIEAASPY